MAWHYSSARRLRARDATSNKQSVAAAKCTSCKDKTRAGGLWRRVYGNLHSNCLVA